MLLGCRSGAACPFRHEAIDTAQQSTATVQQQPSRRSPPSRQLERAVGAETDPTVPSRSTRGRQHAPVNTSRITQRPVPQSQLADPREYQLSQLRRRFTPEEHDKDSATILTFHLRPSDPDFPFDMDALDCTLHVPFDYPDGGQPTLTVTNPSMERGYQINIERGFDKIVATSASLNLLAHLNSLDRQLESFLSSEKADTVKIVSHKQAEKDETQRHLTVGGKRQAPPSPPASLQRSADPLIVHTSEQKSRAKQSRDAETKQLEARMGRLPQFSRSSDGLTYTVPFEPRRRGDLPIELQAVKLVKLVVPENYSLLPCRIELVGVTGDSASAVQDSFLSRAGKFPEMSLLSQMNYLSQNMNLMAKQTAEPLEKPHVINPTLAPTSPEGLKSGPSFSALEPIPLSRLPDRPHQVTIPTPPEWNTGNENDAESSDSSSEDDERFTTSNDANRSEHDASGSTEMSSTEIPSQERGILISFPHIDLHTVELLEIGTLNITVKCDRCKDTKDVVNLQNNIQDSHTRSDSCNKCANPFTIGFRADLMHANSVRAGYLDLDGCSVVDMLPSSFIPTCAECSTVYTRVGVISVRGETSMAFCRECHRKMSFRIPEIKFLRISASTGIVVGQELANQGRCSHYKKSYRWFRFSCCQKVFACDRCHDQVADHPIEHANRMLWYQNYRPKDCGICHAWLTVRPGKGFWEGGQGTRDTAKMSRKGGVKRATVA
ncbi:uncharacterized protein BDR25DRAFT_333299 [Lindgomyces ingoldianus]|uniref:Uncharacterized protein n=1 Tax=Lindgomyces ingoldianus TaxID=673940 RepID=A0ACB6R0A8_9PLEO|nr:uncharacterized protein BDR25DRAFT_333299 [Lindgomyces ingoldianus]KAF2472472.1 hypothetical protein BDR25DRAFT_333299 [Lindgomyces ingoldianus]